MCMDGFVSIQSRLFFLFLRFFFHLPCFTETAVGITMNFELALDHAIMLRLSCIRITAGLDGWPDLNPSF